MSNAVIAPSIAYGPLAPLISLLVGSIVVLLVGMIPGRSVQRAWMPLLTLLTLAIAAIFAGMRWGELGHNVLSGALIVDDFSLAFYFVFIATASATVVLAWRSPTVAAIGGGEFYALLLAAVTGMALLASAENLVAFFVGFELFSIPLYVLCAADLRRRGSLESGLKYLIIGSLGSATMLYGLAFIYGATGTTDFSGIHQAVSQVKIGDDAILLLGVALTLAGLAFKASIAPFHQWTPDVYEGAPTPVTAFMAVATKAAAFAILLRFFDVTLAPIHDHWAPALAVLATVTIIVGNLGALVQNSLKRLLAYSGVAQAGYLAAGVVVGTELGVRAVIFYLFAYLLMNVGPFAVVHARERAGAGGSISGLNGLGRENPALAWSMTVCMVALAGLPVTAGFLGKFFLIEATIDGGYSWLAVVIVLGSALSLGYYLRVVAAIWMTSASPEPATGAPESTSKEAHQISAGGREISVLAAAAATATVVFGLVPGPLLDVATAAGRALITLV